MTKEIVVSHGLCSAIRPKVLTALKPYKFKDLKIETWGEGRWGVEGTAHLRFPDMDAWVQKHVAVITVSDDAAGWAEWLLWQSHKVMLESEPHPKYRHLDWSAPPNCKEQTSLGRGNMPTPWSENARPDWWKALDDKKKTAPKVKATKRTTAAKQPAKRKAKPKAQGRRGLSGALQIRR